MITLLSVRLVAVLGNVSYSEVTQTGGVGRLGCSGGRYATGHRRHTAHHITTDPSIRYIKLYCMAQNISSGGSWPIRQSFLSVDSFYPS